MGDKQQSGKSPPLTSPMRLIEQALLSKSFLEAVSTACLRSCMRMQEVKGDGRETGNAATESIADNFPLDVPKTREANQENHPTNIQHTDPGSMLVKPS